LQRTPRHFIKPIKNCAIKKVYTLKIDQSELDMLIKLLEFSNMEILRTCKKFSESDFDLKEIYWNYRYNSNLLRKKLQNLRD
jgi:hypothetical protein